MNEGFARTVHSLGSERRLSTLGLFGTGLLLLIWLVWLFTARISVFEVTREGRVEADRASYPIAARVDGRVVEMLARVGQRVAAGEILVELDTEELLARRREEEARHAALLAELEAMREELGLAEQTFEENRRTGLAALEAARSRVREAEIEAGFAEEEAERAAVLHRDGQLSRVEMERGRSLAARLRAKAESERLDLDRDVSAERSGELSDRTEIAQLRGRAARLEGEAQSSAAKGEEIAVLIEKRTVRAPRDGEIGEIRHLTAAALVTEGEVLGTVLAAGELVMVAELAAASALGRVRLGQRAQMRLDGFPWTQYGTLAAEVRRVATEPRDGRLRVELEIDADAAARLPVRHGLTGTVEIEVERLSPALLLLRTLGKAVEGRDEGRVEGRDEE